MKKLFSIVIFFVFTHSISAYAGSQSNTQFILNGLAAYYAQNQQEQLNKQRAETTAKQNIRSNESLKERYYDILTDPSVKGDTLLEDDEQSSCLQTPDHFNPMIQKNICSYSIIGYQCHNHGQLKQCLNDTFRETFYPNRRETNSLLREIVSSTTGGLRGVEEESESIYCRDQIGLDEYGYVSCFTTKFSLKRRFNMY